MAATGYRHPLRNAAGIFAKAAGALLLVLALAVAGALVWLRTDSAARFLADTTAEALKGMGLHLDIDDIKGPLPGRLTITGLVLADDAGPLIKAGAVTLETNLASLFRGRLAIPLVRLDEPEIIRLPAPPPDETPPTKNGGLPAIPLDIVLDQFAVTGGTLHTNALLTTPGGGDDEADANTLPALLSFTLSGSASLRSHALTVRLAASLNDPHQQGVRLDLNLVSGVERLLRGDRGQPGGKEDELDITILAGEGAHGPIAALLGLADFPGYSLHMSGKGPVRDWKGELRLAFGASDSSEIMTAEAVKASSTADKAQLLARADFGLQCKTGSFWHDLVAERNFDASLSASLAPGAEAPAPLRPVLGDALRLYASVEGKETRLTATASLDSPALAVRIVNASLSPYQQGDGPAAHALQATRGDGSAVTKGAAAFASLSVRALDMPALLGLAALGSPAAQETGTPAFLLPLRALALSADVSTLLDTDFSWTDASGTVNVEADDDAFSIGYACAVVQEGAAFSLRNLRLDGLGLIAEAQGAARADTLSVTASANITAADNAPWQKLAARLAGLTTQSDGEPPLGGSIDLAAELNLPGLPSASKGKAKPTVPATTPASGFTPVPASGALTLRARDMRWPSARLSAILDTAMDARLRLEGGKPDASGLPSEYRLFLEDAVAGVINAQGQASFTPGRDGGIPDGLLDAACKAQVSDLRAIAGEGVSGSLSLTASAKGPLSALDVALEAGSPTVKTGAGAFKGVSFSLTGRNTLQAGATLFDGALSAALADSPGGPVRLAGDIQAHVPPSAAASRANGVPHADDAEPVRAEIRDFSVQGAGLSVKADITAAIPPVNGTSTAAPELRGTFNARVDDWGRLAALTGAPLSGEPASLELRLDNAAGGQSVFMNASLPRLLLKEPDKPDTLRLQDVTANLAGSDIFGAPSLTLDLRTGRGKAAFLLWNTGEGSVRGSGGTGEFSLSLRQEGGRSGQRSGTVIERRRQERLALAGRYDLAHPSVFLSTFSLWDPRSKTGLDLAKPVTLDLTDGITLKDLELTFQPGGRLTAEASIKPATMTARATLAELPFAFFSLFTQSALPDGTLSAQADIRTGASGPTGVFSIDSVLSATTDITGISKHDPAGGATAPGPGALAAAAGAPASALALHIDGKLGTDPGPAILAGSGVRRLPGKLWLRGDGTFGSAGKTKSAREGSLAFQIPLLVDANGVPSPDSGSPIATSIRFNGPASVLWQAVPTPDRYLNGQMRMEADVSGSMNAPRHQVRAYLAGGSFEDVINGVLVSGINLEATSTEKGDITALAAADDGRSGKFALQADVTGLQGGGVPNLKVRGQLKQFRPLHRDDLDIVLSGILGVNGPLDSIAVTGTIAVEQGEVILSRLTGGSVPVLEVTDSTKSGSPRATSQQGTQASAGSADAEPPAPTGPSLDIKVMVPQYFFIRGMGLESEWQGDLKITGSAAEPSLVGALSPVRGYFDIFSRSFQFTGGEIAFAGGKEINPALSLELTYEGPDITALIKTSGTAKAPRLSLVSRPPLPQDEVLARVLFGKRTSALSRFEAIQLANNMRELTGFGGSGFDMLSGVRKQIGLDMLRIGGASGPAQRATSGQSGEGNLTGRAENAENETEIPALEAGKYINDSIYIGVEQGATENSTAVRVEVELYPRITLEGKSSADTSEVGIGWKMDY